MNADIADEIVREGDLEWAKPVVRALVRDKRLTFAARGLFIFLWDLPKGWKPCLAHIAAMGPEGRTSLAARLAELRAVGAVRIEPIRGAAGRVAGSRWTLVAADRWAVEALLHEHRTENQVSRLSAKPTVGKPDAKVHPVNQGSPPPPPPGGGGGDPPPPPTDIPQAWADALAVETAIEMAVRPIRNLAGFRRRVLARYAAEGGPDPATLAEVEWRRQVADRDAERRKTLGAAASAPATPEVAARGLAAANAILHRRPQQKRNQT